MAGRPWGAVHFRGDGFLYAVMRVQEEVVNALATKPHMLAEALENLAIICANRGDLPGALSRLDDALKLRIEQIQAGRGDRVAYDKVRVDEI